MPKPQTQIDLDIIVANGCQNPQCTDPLCGNSLFLHPACHPSSNPEVEYEKGILHFKCEVCGKRITDIKVAEQ